MITKEQYNQMYPHGCPFKRGDVLTVLGKKSYQQHIGVEYYLFGGRDDGRDYGSTNWIVEEVQGAEQRDGIYGTKLKVKPPNYSGTFTMMDIEFQEFWVFNNQVVTNYEIY